MGHLGSSLVPVLWTSTCPLMDREAGLVLVGERSASPPFLAVRWGARILWRRGFLVSALLWNHNGEGKQGEERGLGEGSAEKEIQKRRRYQLWGIISCIIPTPCAAGATADIWWSENLGTNLASVSCWAKHFLLLGHSLFNLKKKWRLAPKFCTSETSFRGREEKFP